MEFWGQRGCRGWYRRVEIWVVEGSSEGRQGVRAGEKRGTEAGACCAWRGRSRAMGRGERSDGGETRRCAPVQGAVFRVVQVISGEGWKRFISPSLAGVRTGVGLCS